MDKWKPRPKSFPEMSPEHPSAADLNQFFDTRDTEVASSSLQRDESFAESTYSDSDRPFQPKINNSRLLRARDSIFITKEHIKDHMSREEEDDEDEDDQDNNEEREQTEQETTFVLGHSNLRTNNNNSIKQQKSRISQVRFSSLPNENEEHTNPAFVDDDGNEMDDFEEDPKNDSTQKPEWQKNEDWDNHWNANSSEDDDESAVDYEKPSWDTFESLPIEDVDETLSSEWSKFFLKLFKLVSYGITFVFVLFFGVVAKLSMHLIASMTQVNKTVINCNKDLPMEDHDKRYHSLLGLNSPERFAWLWVLFFVTITPDLLTFLRSLKICLFKQYKIPDNWSIFLIFSTHSAEVIGVSLFTYVVLPSIDVISGLIFTNCLFLLPSFCLLMSRKRLQQKLPEPENALPKQEESERGLFFYTLAFSLQLIALIAWPFVLYYRDLKNFEPVFGRYSPRDETNFMWITPLSGFLISLGYWENFITENSTFKFMRTFGKIKKLPIVSKYAVYLYVSIWKCLLSLAMLVLIQGFAAYYHEHDLSASWATIQQVFSDFTLAFGTHNVDLIRENSKVDDTLHYEVNGWPPIIIGLIQIGSSFLCYQTVLFVCKICIQPFSFALPINLILPVSVSVMNLMVNYYMHQPCVFSDFQTSFEYIFWNVHYNLFDLNKPWNYAILILWLITFVSQVITTNHIWISSKERLASIDQLFILPYYTSGILEQSIMLNRRLDEELFSVLINSDSSTEAGRGTEFVDSESIISASGIDTGNKAEKIRIYACATVWHETSDELVQMLKSIMRVDEDQAQRRLAVKWLGVKERQVDYYEFETHLFVDDAFIYGKSMTENDRIINEYVKILIDVLNEAAENVHQRVLKIKPPRIFITPYGGRLEWRLPGGTKLIAHLKDKLKIRHRKRWSQVMYMYYLLGYKIYEKESDPEIRAKITNNTFILALDGDINFRPEAVLLLVDLMRKNKGLGAACGRVHPVGTGPMAWYQTFEYAISHWLQKATEHVFGCVLCSPGCFSLFRASALVDINVMNRYTTKPSEAIHYVQYDQGEDRWLCTLMLQQGWRVEYSAASDSYTHCPEGFGEFYIQRRRWAPSTMANIIDLLRSYKHTVKKNDNISSLYMLYQACLMLGTILSPGTIFLMLVGAVNTAFSLRTEISFYINFFPVLVFVLVCFFCKTDIQILVAQILSTFYAMLMLAVLTSTAIEIKKETIFSPSVIFFVGMLVVFVVAAVIHPQEFTCLFPAPVYMLTIPCMYLLLTIYSIINLNIVTWGTRETPQQLTPQQQQEQQKQQAQKKDSNLLLDLGSYLNRSAKWDFNCMCCTSTKNDEELFYLRDIKDSINKVNTDVYDIKTRMDTQTKARAEILKRRKSVMGTASRTVSFNDILETRPLIDEMMEDEEELEVINSIETALNQEKEEEKAEEFSIDNPPWVRDEGLANAKTVSIKADERDFWTAFIGKYLKPLDEDKAHQEKVKADLIDLRNKAVFAFGIINIIFVLFVYLLQINKDLFSITFHMNQHENGSIYDPETNTEKKTYTDTPVNMDPIGLVLIIFFGSILIIQCIGMFLHRFGTITHLLAFIDLNFFQVKEEDLHDDKIVDQNAVSIVRYIMKNYDNKDDDELNFSMERHFQRHYLKLRPDKIAKDLNLPRRKSTANALLTRQKTARRKSIAADMSINYLRQFQQTHSQFMNNDNEPEVITQLELDLPWISSEMITSNEHHSDDENDIPLLDVRTLSTHFAQGVIHDAMASFQRHQAEGPARGETSNSSSDFDSGHSENQSDEANTVDGAPNEVATLAPSDQVHDFRSQVTRL